MPEKALTIYGNFTSISTITHEQLPVKQNVTIQQNSGKPLSYCHLPSALGIIPKTLTLFLYIW
jgi:hypothetical protein